jgi:hypothetical protein
MVVPILLVGTFVDVPRTVKNVIPQPGVAPGVQNYPGTPLNTSLPGTVPRRYKWLPWHAGMISDTVLDSDVLTGPMSGCLLAGYFDTNGGRHAVHIGTTEDRAQSDAVKAAWRGRAVGFRNQEIVGFDPATMSGLTLPDHVAGAEFPNPEIWGLITTTGRLFGLKVYWQIGNPTQYRIARVEEIDSLDDAVIRNWRV